MATLAFTAKGTSCLINGVKIAEPREFGLPTIEREEIEATHLDSDFQEFLNGLKDGGEFTVMVNYVPTDAGQAALAAALEQETSQPFEVRLPINPATTLPREVWTFGALVRSREPSGFEVNGVVTMQWTMRVTGNLTIAVP